MCGFIYYRHVSNRCAATKKHIMKTRIIIWCDKARIEDKVCALEDCVHRPDMETRDLIPYDMTCCGCTPTDEFVCELEEEEEEVEDEDEDEDDEVESEDDEDDGEDGQDGEDGEDGEDGDDGGEDAEKEEGEKEEEGENDINGIDGDNIEHRADWEKMEMDKEADWELIFP